MVNPDFLKQFDDLSKNSLNDEKLLGANCFFHKWTKWEKINNYEQERICLNCGKIKVQNYNLPTKKKCNHVWKEKGSSSIVQGSDIIGLYYIFFCTKCGAHKQDTIYVSSRGKNQSIIVNPVDQQ